MIAPKLIRVLRFAQNDIKAVKLALGKSQLLTARIVLLALSVISLVICVVGAAPRIIVKRVGETHGSQSAGCSACSFCLLLFCKPAGAGGRFKSVVNPKAAFFLFWILFFVVSHLWNFRTAPWNGDALFDESG